MPISIKTILPHEPVQCIGNGEQMVFSLARPEVRVHELIIQKPGEPPVKVYMCEEHYMVLFKALLEYGKMIMTIGGGMQTVFALPGEEPEEGQEAP